MMGETLMQFIWIAKKFLAATSSLMNGIFRLSHIFHCSHHGIIMKFPGVISYDQGKVHANGQMSRSQRSQPNLTVSGPKLQFEFTNDVLSLMTLRRGALLFVKVIRQISSTHF